MTVELTLDMVVVGMVLLFLFMGIAIFAIPPAISKLLGVAKHD